MFYLEHAFIQLIKIDLIPMFLKGKKHIQN